MRSFWSDPYLWIHLAGFAAVPIFLNLCLIGFAMSNPVLPTGLELLLVAIAGIAPILWMQWQRPFYIFSLPGLVLKPTELTEAQRKLLTLFKAQRNRVIAVVIAIALIFVLQWLYNSAAIAAEVAPFSHQNRFLGLLLAAIGFLGVNLFTQVPASVLSVLLTREPVLTATPDYPIGQIQQNFSLLGLQLGQVLPPIQPEAKLPFAKESEVAPTTLTAKSPLEETTASVPAAIDLPDETPDVWDEVEAEATVASDQTSQPGIELVPGDDFDAKVAKPPKQNEP
jgi:hypothetical protein